MSKNRNISKEKEKKPSSIPETIVERTLDYIENGKPEYGGGLALGRPPKESDLSNRAGGRENLCGYTSAFVLEVVEGMRQNGDQLASQAIQAEQLLYSLHVGAKLEKPPSFYRHGFNIVINQDNNRWWIIDPTLIQFIDEKEGGKLMFHTSGLEVDNKSNYYPSVVANTIFENGYIEGSPENLAAYISALRVFSSEKSFYNTLLEKFRDKDIMIKSGAYKPII
ncbi:MAG: hypothetical protein P8Y17_02435 [Patescibacteria group bacterium]